MKFRLPHRTLLICLLLIWPTAFLAAQDIAPYLKIKTSGAITDLFIEGSVGTISTDAGTIESYDLKTGRQTSFTQLQIMIDFMGDEMPTKVYSIDKLDNQMLLVTQGDHGFRNVLIRTADNETIKIFDAAIDRMMVKKARFVGDEQILLGMMSNELVLYDVGKKETVYTLTVSAYTFSDFVLSNDKQIAFSSDESGIVHKINIPEGEIIGEYSGNNVDNVYKLAYDNGMIVTAGQDRRVGVYRLTTDNQYFLQKDFLVYCVGLNEDGTIGAFTADEDNTITVFDTFTKQEKERLIGHDGVVTKIEFIDDKTIVSTSDDRFLMVWRL